MQSLSKQSKLSIKTIERSKSFKIELQKVLEFTNNMTLKSYL